MNRESDGCEALPACQRLGKLWPGGQMGSLSLLIRHAKQVEIIIIVYKIAQLSILLSIIFLTDVNTHFFTYYIFLFPTKTLHPPNFYQLWPTSQNMCPPLC